MVVVTRLEQLRLDAHLSPEALGKLANVSGVTIRSYESGAQDRPHVGPLGKLADHFNVPASELLQPAVFRGPTDSPVSETTKDRAA